MTTKTHEALPVPVVDLERYVRVTTEMLTASKEVELLARALIPKLAREERDDVDPAEMELVIQGLQSMHTVFSEGKNLVRIAGLLRERG